LWKNRIVKYLIYNSFVQFTETPVVVGKVLDALITSELKTQSGSKAEYKEMKPGIFFDILTFTLTLISLWKGLVLKYI